jgi:predicted GIY-YIG superfamily endonuclease
MTPERHPWFKFHTSDWRGDDKLRSCSLAAQGLWINCLAIMHVATPRGYLNLTTKQLALLMGRPMNEVAKALAELEHHGVSSRNEAGWLYSRRMVRDTAKAITLAENGRLGGNPKLTSSYNVPGYVYAMCRESDGQIKIGISTNPSKRLSRIKYDQGGGFLTLLDSAPVMDMGAEEARLHAMFTEARAGEWFQLNDKQRMTLDHELSLLKEKSTIHLKETSGHPLKPARVMRVLASSLTVPEPEQASTETPKPQNSLVLARFETFWDAYPRKTGRKAALRVFQALNPNHEQLGVWLDALAAWKRSAQWRSGIVPHATTWLNGERWADEVPPEPVPVLSGTMTRGERVTVLNQGVVERLSARYRSEESELQPGRALGDGTGAPALAGRREA